MVKGPTSTAVAPVLASKPKHQHESTALIVSESDTALDRDRQISTQSHRGGRNSENRNEFRNHQQERYHQQHTLPRDSPFLSPPTTTKKQSRSSKTEAQWQRKKQEARSSNAFHEYLSPTPLSTGAGTRRVVSLRSRKMKPKPLVLDATARSVPGQLGACNSEHRRVTLSSNSSASLVDSRGGNSTVKKLFQVATEGIRQHHATAAQYTTPDSNFHALVNTRGYKHATPAALDTAFATTASTAAVFARSNGVVHAGFLQKLGKNIPEFKRRFFVLKPETSLYYFLSPNETEPRGKIDLEGSTIEQVEKTSDGRFRFVVSLKSEDQEIQKIEFGDSGSYEGNNHVCNNKPNSYQRKKQQIVLEARSAEIGEEWIRHMKGERVSILKEKNESLATTISKQANQISDLEQQLQHFRMIETDRDGALEDARNWKNKFQRLDEALRLLTQQMRKAISLPLIQERKSDHRCDNSEDQGVEKQIFDEKAENAQVADVADEISDDAKFSSSVDTRNGIPDNINNITPIKKNSGLALFDDVSHDDMDVEEIMDVPGTYFSGLSNVCKQQKESSRLASLEASAAVEDVLKANERVEITQKRMHKAEKQILKLWEENCVIRKALKQRKREKRVLVKEVRQLQQTVKDLNKNMKQSLTLAHGSRKPYNEDEPMADTIIGSDEERLIIELEEHVASSIRLHERLIAGVDFDRDMEQSISTEPASVNFDATNTALGGESSRFERSDIETGRAKLLSLLDDETDSDESNEQEKEWKDPDYYIETQSTMGSIASSKDNIAMDYIQPIIGVEKPQSLSVANNNSDSSPKRINPLLELDDHNNENSLKGNVASIMPSSPKLITENGQATSRLVCPLADVVDVKRRSSCGNDTGLADREETEDLRVHHLTFYSRKIGLQFQKAPPAPSKARGLLTDAITADLVGEVNGSTKTAAELRSVASIASLAKGGFDERKEKNKHHSMAVPKDIVLVCGFEGFDDSGVNQRPKLGARLVAFDGVSVEVGKWDFESIRKAIKSRGRPLTLSFRYDFLTTEQRATLTKAVRDIDAKRDLSIPIPKYEQPESSILSIGSTQRKNLKYPKRVDHPDGPIMGKSLDMGTAATEESNYCNLYPPSSGSSISSDFKDNTSGRLLPRLPSSLSVSTHKSRNSTTSTTNNSLSSFNEGGSSGAVSSLMNALAKRSSTPSEPRGGGPITPETNEIQEGSERSRSRRFGTGVNPSGTRQHQDFQANLL